MQSIRLVLLNASLIALGVLAFCALAQSLSYYQRRTRRRDAMRRAFLTQDIHEAHSVYFLRF